MSGSVGPLDQRHHHGMFCQWHLAARQIATRNVVLTDAQSAMIERLVANGRYQNASEALRAGLRLLERDEAEIDALRLRLEAGVREARAGELAEGSGEEVVRRAFAQAREEALARQEG